MMDARLGWLLLGCIIGFIVGYIVRSLREIKDGVNRVDKRINRTDDSGLVRYPLLMDLLLLIVVGMTVWASVSSQLNSNQVKKTQSRVDRNAACTEQFLAKTIIALNERTVYSQQGTQSNVDLQKAFNKIVVLSLRTPPLGEKAARKAVQEYAAALAHFLDLSEKSTSKVQENPFPTNSEFQTCINRN